MFLSDFRNCLLYPAVSCNVTWLMAFVTNDGLATVLGSVIAATTGALHSPGITSVD